jgi:hypothetical protein
VNLSDRSNNNNIIFSSSNLSYCFFRLSPTISQPPTANRQPPTANRQPHP